MDLQHNVFPSPSQVKLDPSEAARTLSELLSQTPEYRAFLDALKALNTNLTIQKLSTEMRTHQTALKWERASDGRHVSELTRLELEMEDHPVVKTYRQTELEISALLRAVDEIISNEAGVAFAVNAQRSGCSCGG